MKIHYVLLLCCLFVAVFPLTGMGEGTLHTFTTPDGRSLKAEIKDYNDHTGKIQIEREDGKKLWTLPTVFSEADQGYIRQWIAVDQFMSPSQFKIKGDSTRQSTSKTKDIEGTQVKLEDKTEIVYEIILENRTDFPLIDLRIEYRAFILNEGYEGRENSDRVTGGQLIITGIPAGGKVSQLTHPMAIFTQYKTKGEGDSSRGVSWYGLKTNQERLKGFWIKVYGPEIDGETIVREWCYPSDTSEKFAWQDTFAPPSLRLLNTHEYSDEENKLLNRAHDLCFNMKNYEKALEVYHEAYEIAQAPIAAWCIGRIYLDDLKPPNGLLGLEWMEKAASGNYYHACCMLAFNYTYNYRQYGNAEKAIKYGLQAVSIDPDYYEGYRRLADAYAYDGQYDKAVETMELAIEHTDNAFSSGVMKEQLKRYRNNKFR